MKVDKKLFWFRAETFADSVDNPSVCLMGNDAFDFCDINFAPAQGFRRGGVHRLNGVLESFLAFHSQVMQARGYRLGGGWTTAAAAGHKEEVGFLAVSSHDSGKKAVRLGTI